MQKNKNFNQMSEITRQDLLNNLSAFDTSKNSQNEKAWQRLMKKLDDATKCGIPMVNIPWGGSEFSLDECQYFQKRCEKEGMRWRFSDSQGEDYDGYVFLIIEV